VIFPLHKRKHIFDVIEAANKARSEVEADCVERFPISHVSDIIIA
jgi:hypothetical protein